MEVLSDALNLLPQPRKSLPNAHAAAKTESRACSLQPIAYSLLCCWFAHPPADNMQDM